MAYPHYPYQLCFILNGKEHAATPYPGYSCRDVQYTRITRRRLALAELHVIHCLADEPVIRLCEVSSDCILHGIGIEALFISQGKYRGACARQRGSATRSRNQIAGHACAACATFSAL